MPKAKFTFDFSCPKGYVSFWPRGKNSIETQRALDAACDYFEREAYFVRLDYDYNLLGDPYYSEDNIPSGDEGIDYIDFELRAYWPLENDEEKTALLGLELWDQFGVFMDAWGRAKNDQ